MPFYQKLVIPDEQNLYIVSDIHGMYTLYKEGCKRIGITGDDIVISLGDLIDRSKENLKCLVEFTQTQNRYMVLGNHELMMFNGLSDRNAYYNWFVNGGDTTLSELGEEGVEVACKWLVDKPVILEVHHRGKKLGLVHGGIPCSYQETGFEFKESIWDDVIWMSKTEEGRELLLWERNTISNHYANKQTPRIHAPVKPVKDIDYVFHGHTYVEKPLHITNRIYTDTGSVFNNKICFSWLDDDEVKHYITGEDD